MILSDRRIESAQNMMVGIAQSVLPESLTTVPLIEGQCRCGLCCSTLDIGYFNKPVNVPCLHLRGTASKAACNQYDSRPPVCRDFSCDGAFPRMQQTLEKFVLESLAGRSDDIYYEEDEPVLYPTVDSVYRLLTSLRLQYSPTVMELYSGRDLNPRSALAVHALMSGGGNETYDLSRVRDMLGVNHFLRNQSSEGARLITACMDQTNPSLDVEREFIARAAQLNPNFEIGVRRFRQGEVSLPEPIQAARIDLSGMLRSSPLQGLRERILVYAGA